MNKQSFSANKYITRDLEILGGKPIIKGTRLSVEVLLEFLAGGMEIKEILEEFPYLNREQVEAAIRFAAEEVGKKKRQSPKKLESASPATLHEIRR